MATKNNNYICVFDFETDSTDPRTCNPVQLGAIILEPENLTMVANSAFNSLIRPDDFDDENYIRNHESTIDWHVSNKMKNSAETRGKIKKQLLRAWETAPTLKTVWQKFTSYLNKYHTRQSRQSMFSAPIFAGANIKKFDMIIIDRLCQKYGDINKNGTSSIYHPRNQIDIIDLSFHWFWHKENGPSNHTMDELRKFFKIKQDNAHDALADVYDEGIIIAKLMRHSRKCELITNWN